MGSRFIEKTLPTTGTTGGPFRGSEKPILTWFQFVPALVVDTVVNAFSPYYESDRDINAIIVKVHYEDAFGGSIRAEKLATELYYPLFANMGNPPIRGEQVLVCTFGGINYYMGPVNTVNLPNFNPDILKKAGAGGGPSFRDNTKRSISHLYGFSKNYSMIGFKKLGKASIRPLDRVKDDEPGDIHGDMVLEGRHGNSIRIGSRYRNPYVVLSNGRPSEATNETLYDGSLIGITNAGTLAMHYGEEAIYIEDRTTVPYILPSDRIEGNNRVIGAQNSEDTESRGLYDYDFANNQIMQSSDKITIASNMDSIFLSSFRDTVIGTGNNLQITSNKATIIESSNIYLGKQASQNEEPEPLVLGNKITDILKEIVSILETMKVTGCVAGMSGPPAPDVIAKITSLKTTLDAVAHLSEYHFIEDNGQKAE